MFTYARIFFFGSEWQCDFTRNPVFHFNLSFFTFLHFHFPLLLINYIPFSSRIFSASSCAGIMDLESSRRKGRVPLWYRWVGWACVCAREEGERREDKREGEKQCVCVYSVKRLHFLTWVYHEITILKSFNFNSSLLYCSLFHFIWFYFISFIYIFLRWSDCCSNRNRRE